jgi:uncharacterized membrane protein YphA (DoxX/SURF4 family)
VVESKAALWTGRVLTGFVVLFLLFDGVIKLTNMQVVTDTLNSLGYPPKHAVMIGIVELACVILLAIPRTAVLGAVLLTALLGGGIATHIRVDSPLFSHTLFGVYLGIVTWAGLYLREPRVRALLPLRS